MTTGRELGTGTDGSEGGGGCAGLAVLRGVRVRGAGGVVVSAASAEAERARVLRGARVGFGVSAVIGFSWSALGLGMRGSPALRIAVRTVSRALVSGQDHRQRSVTNVCRSW